VTDRITWTFGDTTLSLATHPRAWSPTSFAASFAVHLADAVQPGQRVLELGLGTGVLSILAGVRGADVTGLDINPDAVRLTAENWAHHGLPERADRFRVSDRFAALSTDERFDRIWSNPPVLPDIGAPPTGDRDDFEVAGDEGRLVLDAMLDEAGRWLAPEGRMLTIATSLQGRDRTRALLEARWSEHRILAHHELALTDECGPAYIAYWRARSADDGARRVFQRPGDPTWWHDVWILEARGPR